MTPNTRSIPLARMRYPSFVQYDGQVYRAWKPLPLAVLDGTVLIATTTTGEQVGLIYANNTASVELVVG